MQHADIYGQRLEQESAMMSCAHVEEIEELALGLLTDIEAARAQAHLAACESCREEHERFVVERALFDHRAAAVTGPAPYLAAAVLDSVAKVDSEGHASIATAARALIAAAACVAAIMGTGWIDQSSSTVPRPIHARATETGIAAVQSSVDEPLACALPVSGFVHLQRRGDEGLACVVADHATCEERVTSSIATP